MGGMHGMSTQCIVGLMADIYGLDGVTFDMVVCIGGCCWVACMVRLTHGMSTRRMVSLTHLMSLTG